MKLFLFFIFISCSTIHHQDSSFNGEYLESSNQTDYSLERDISHKRRVTLYPMFNSGTPFICTKGVMAGPGRSHNTKNSKYAIDLQLKSPSPLRSVFNGTAVVYNRCKNRKSRCGYGFGNFVKILSPSGYVAFYSHLSKVSVMSGQSIKVGDIIGYEGRSGNASGSHTHFSIHHSWKTKGLKAHMKSPVLLPDSVNFNLNTCMDKNNCSERLIINASDLTCRTKNLRIYKF